jgi:hypothetical protein
MLGFKTKKVYLSPSTSVTEVDLEGLICQSNLMLGPQVDELKNMNAETPTASDPGGSLYFEF